MSKPRVITKCVANAYTGPDERIIEFSFGGGVGGLIAFRAGRGRPLVNVYRTDGAVDVVGPCRVDSTDLMHSALKRIKGRLAGEWYDPASDLESDIGAVVRNTLAAVNGDAPAEDDVTAALADKDTYKRAMVALDLLPKALEALKGIEPYALSRLEDMDEDDDSAGTSPEIVKARAAYDAAAATIAEIEAAL